MTPLRVLQVDAGRDWRGGQNQVRLLARALAAEPGVAQRLVTRRGSRLARSVAAVGVPVVETAWTISLDPRALWTLVRQCRAFTPRIVHAHDSHALFLAVAARALTRARRRFDTRVVATRRVDFPVTRHGPWHRVDHVIAVSERVKVVLVESGLDPARITVVPSGVDPGEVRAAATPPFGVRSRLGLPPSAPIAVNVGALTGQKDHGTLIRAAQATRARQPDLHWVVAGAGPLRTAIEEQIRASGLTDRVHLVGHVEPAPALVGEADVFVLSSSGEGLPNAAAEALALGKPVVATRAGGTPELLPAEWLVDVGDHERLASRVLAALERRPRLELPARYTAAAMARGVLDVYGALA